MDVAFDTETLGLNWWDGQTPFLVSAAANSGFSQSFCVGKAGGEETEAVIALDRPGSRLIAHNLSFDVHQLRAGGIVDLLQAGQRLVDTDLLARIVLPERRFAEKGSDESDSGYKLKDLATTYVDPNAKDSQTAMEELAKSAGVKMRGKHATPEAYYQVWRAFPDEVEHYAREDARLTLGLLHALESKLTEKTRRIWELETALAPIIIGAEARGIRIDTAKVPPLRNEYRLEAERTAEILDRELGEGWDENTDELADRLQGAGVMLTELTPTGKLATNKWALERLEEESPIIRTLLEHRTASKFLSTYIDALDREIVHTSFWQIGTWTGRMASSRPNMQNVPARAGKAVRDLIIPRPGYSFIAMDYEQIEFRALAYYLNDPGLIDLIEAGHDPFADLASKVYGGTPSMYVKGSPGEVQRTVCKNATYAVVYGVGGDKLAKMLGLPFDGSYKAGDWAVQRGFKREGEPRSYAGAALKKQIQRALPNYYRLTRDRIEPTVRERGHVNTIMGRRQPIEPDKAYKGLSGLIQGSAADIFKQAVVDASAAVAPLGAYPVLFVHDEIVFEAPTEAAGEVLRVASQAMETAVDIRPRLTVEGAISDVSYGACK